MKKGSFKRGMALILCAVLAAEPSMNAAAAESEEPQPRSVDETMSDNAMDISEDSGMYYAADDSQSFNSKPVEIVDERTADSRSFQMSDHSVKKIIYSEDISYEKDGSFILINNGLYGDADSSVGTDGSTANGYRNVAGDFNASFAAAADGKHLFSVDI